MSDVIAGAEDTPRSNLPELTVSEVSGAVKRALEDQFGRVRVRGEVSRVSRPRSGHVYLDLKDDRAVLASVIWKGQLSRLEAQPEEGDEVIAEGKLTTFPGQSKYQLIIDRLAHAGAGALLAKLERLKAALAAEGLFAAERKRPIPFLPQVIGVVTSPSGAVIRDILHRIGDRFGMRVLVWPVAVQGAGCAPEVARALRGFNALAPDGAIPRPDVLIVARGGGSVEDLWGFNDEAVVRAVAASAIPVISAVGHETDWTLIDLAADIRAPTPTAAAEMAAPVRRELAAKLAGLQERRLRAMARALAEGARRLRDLARGLPAPDALLSGPRQRLDRAADLAPRALAARAAAQRLRLARGRAGRFGPALLRGRLATLRGGLRDRGARLAPALARGAAAARRRAEALAARATPSAPRRAARQGREALRALSRRAARARAQSLQALSARLDRAGRLLETLSHRATLARGFALVRAAPVASGAPGPALTRAAQIAPGQALEIEFSDGRRRAVAAGAPSAPKAKGRGKRGDGQGALF
ncbi:MAG: exodeoxyribonuclease VII large subunit [Rubrimonas sp.]|uniref:exodeoxyribonuclease VII large subunit n=1 Tax=Rubrimonas sp. TaxID=2036015 RepID=UPI002FDEE471